ncbi:Hypothetical predicted protein [Mytilus galloprovincialis]|uniref:Peptidase A2 domain-containing protein n=1 Tax=Mytilus galloprovincialis TaxID=29158 RepID=A0A8B6CNL3_MYTGA|nr:Hypothetical predicted protein [Mytilus galloprovincialis]
MKIHRLSSTDVRLCLFAIKDTGEGEEISYDYGDDSSQMEWRSMKENTESSHENAVSDGTKSQDIAKTASAMHCTTYSQVLLKTAIATVHSNAQVSMDANILFDEGAQRSFITDSLAEQLELKPKGTEAISISGFGGGADHYWDFIEDKIIRGNGPTAVKSRIGYLLSGPTQKSTEGTTSMMNILIGHKEEEYDLENFWKIESLGITPQNKEKSNAEYLENFISTNISYDAKTCKYTAKLPWKDDHKPLPSNIDIARRRTENVVRRLSNDPFLLRKYGEIINDQEKRCFIERIDNPTTSTEHAHYIPHHSVKKDSATTPIRIVYDCSCRRSQDTPSLNDCLCKEPPILNDISTLLMPFRENRYAIVTDIEKAFLQITLYEKDRYDEIFLAKGLNRPYIRVDYLPL